MLFQNDSVATLLARVVGTIGPLHVTRHARLAKNVLTADGGLYERDPNGGGFCRVHPKPRSLAARRALPFANCPFGHDQS